VKDTEAAYLAGIIDGEGYIGHRCVQVELTDQDIALKVAELMGSPSVGTRQRGAYKRTWRAEVYGERALAVLATVLPYLGERRAAKARESLDRS